MFVCIKKNNQINTTIKFFKIVLLGANKLYGKINRIFVLFSILSELLMFFLPDWQSPPLRPYKYAIAVANRRNRIRLNVYRLPVFTYTSTDVVRLAVYGQLLESTWGGVDRSIVCDVSRRDLQSYRRISINLTERTGRFV